MKNFGGNADEWGLDVVVAIPHRFAIRNDKRALVVEMP
jgi:hypothetical protein